MEHRQLYSLQLGQCIGSRHSLAAAVAEVHRWLRSYLGLQVGAPSCSNCAELCGLVIQPGLAPAAAGWHTGRSSCLSIPTTDQTAPFLHPLPACFAAAHRFRRRPGVPKVAAAGLPQRSQRQPGRTRCSAGHPGCRSTAGLASGGLGTHAATASSGGGGSRRQTLPSAAWGGGASGRRGGGGLSGGGTAGGGRGSNSRRGKRTQLS